MLNVVLVAFEGPDRYSFVGGLATRMNDLAEALVARGHRVHQLFVGDPSLPPREEREDGRLVLERWAQWLSTHYPRDVYDGEWAKVDDLTRSLPAHLVDDVVVPATRRGEGSILLFEDWQTAGAAIGTAALLAARGEHAAVLWNANNTYGFADVDFELLRRVAGVTTISHYMRGELARMGVDAALLPNGIAARWLRPLPPSDPALVRRAFGDRPTFVKVARFDPDKRWLWAVDAVAVLRDAGRRPRLVMRGSRSDYAQVITERIATRELQVERLALPSSSAPRDLAAAIAATRAEVVLLDFFVSERSLRALYAAADGVLANSEREPFGLVGLEVMACGGIAYVGRTGEDYAVPFGNCVVVQSGDPRELMTTQQALVSRPELLRSLRAEGRATAKRYAWPRVLDAYEALWELALDPGRR